MSCQAEGDWICNRCVGSFKIINLPLCNICGKAGKNGLCEKCRYSTKLDGLISLFPYQNEGIRRLIQVSKYHNLTDALTFVCRRFHLDVYRRLPPDSYFSLTPIPISANRQRDRGYNQSAVIAETLASLWQLDTWKGLRKAKETHQQVGLTKTERRKNLRGSFTASRCPETVLLVDDVVTTGATLSEAARVLKKGGAKTVWALTIAHG